MRMRYIGSFGVVLLAAAIISAPRAQTKLPAYAVTEVVEVTQEDGYRQFLPLVAKALQDHGARYLARGGRSATISGEPAERGAIIAFDSFDQAQAAFSSAEYTAARAIGDRYAKIRVYVREGLPQTGLGGREPPGAAARGRLEAVRPAPRRRGRIAVAEDAAEGFA